MTKMARIGLPVSLVGMILTAPLLGYCADRGDHYPPRPLLGTATVLVGLSWLGQHYFPIEGNGLPSFETALPFCLPLSLASVSVVLAAAATWGRLRPPQDLRTRFLLVSMGGQALVALAAWVWTNSGLERSHTMPSIVWLGYMTLTQAFALGSTIVLMPLLFSKIPASKFGTVSSGFGIFGAFSAYVLGNLGGTWVHWWTKWRGYPNADYSSLWLLQTGVSLVAVVLVLLCVRSHLVAHLASTNEG
jgi:hypothetical protein